MTLGACGALGGGASTSWPVPTVGQPGRLPAIDHRSLILRWLNVFVISWSLACHTKAPSLPYTARLPCHENINVIRFNGTSEQYGSCASTKPQTFIMSNYAEVCVYSLLLFGGGWRECSVQWCSLEDYFLFFRNSSTKRIVLPIYVTGVPSTDNSDLIRNHPSRRSLGRPSADILTDSHPPRNPDRVLFVYFSA